MESIPLSERIANLENFSTDEIVDLKRRMDRQCTGVKILVAVVVFLAAVAAALSIAVARLVVSTTQAPAAGLSDPRPMNVSWVSTGKDVTVMVGMQPAPQPKGFELEYSPTDPRIPSYQYPGCAIYCNLVQCSCPL